MALAVPGPCTGMEKLKAGNRGSYVLSAEGSLSSTLREVKYIINRSAPHAENI